GPDVEFLNYTLIGERDNSSLISIPSEKEIEICLKSIGQDKAPGPDGMSNGFYLQHWNVIKNDFMAMNEKDATYLGLPLFRSLNRSKDLHFLTERVLQRVKSWKTRLLSKAGRACLIQVVGSSMATYGGNFMDIESRGSDSGMWKAVLEARSILQKGICRGIGNGNNTSIWFDPWVPSSNRTPIPLKDATHGVSWVSQFILPNNRWNVDMATESSLHLFWYCPFAKALWFHLGWSIRTELVTVHTWTQWTEWFKLDSNRPSNVPFIDFMAHTLCIVEGIWKERNRRLVGEKEMDIMRVIDMIRYKTNDHLMVSFRTVPEILSWSPPPSSWLCCNSDVAISSSGSVLAAVFRDEWSNITTIITSKTAVTDPLLAEALAVCLAAELAASMGLNNIIFQSDNLNVVNEFQDLASPLFNLRIQYAKARFSNYCSKFKDWGIIHIPRRCNFMAHNIAKWATCFNVVGRISSDALPDSVLDDLVEWDPSL
ncbi:hypothetical protein G4B88_005116, partial [Cannabis sativa]